MRKLLLRTIIFIVLPLKTYSTNIEDLRGKLYSHMHELSETEMESTKNKLSQLLSSLFIINRDFNLDKLWVDRARPANNIKFETINGSKNLNNETGLLKKITDDDKWAKFVSDYEDKLKDKKILPFLKFTSIFYVLANLNNKKTLGDLPSTTDYIKILDRLCYEISNNYRTVLFGYNNFPTTEALIENGDFLNIIDELRLFFRAYKFYENVITTNDLLYYDMRPSTSEISLENKKYNFINDKNDLANEYRKQLEKIIRNRIENLKLENVEFTFELSKYDNDKYPKIKGHDVGYINNDITGIIKITVDKKQSKLYREQLKNFIYNINYSYDDNKKKLQIYDNFGIEKMKSFFALIENYNKANQIVANNFNNCLKYKTNVDKLNNEIEKYLMNIDDNDSKTNYDENVLGFKEAIKIFSNECDTFCTNTNKLLKIIEVLKKDNFDGINLNQESSFNSYNKYLNKDKEILTFFKNYYRSLFDDPKTPIIPTFQTYYEKLHKIDDEIRAQVINIRSKLINNTSAQLTEWKLKNIDAEDLLKQEDLIKQLEEKDKTRIQTYEEFKKILDIKNYPQPNIKKVYDNDIYKDFKCNGLNKYIKYTIIDNLTKKLITNKDLKDEVNDIIKRRYYCEQAIEYQNGLCKTDNFNPNVEIKNFNKISDLINTANIINSNTLNDNYDIEYTGYYTDKGNNIKKQTLSYKLEDIDAEDIKRTLGKKVVAKHGDLINNKIAIFKEAHTYVTTITNIKSKLTTFKDAHLNNITNQDDYWGKIKYVNVWKYTIEKDLKELDNKLKQAEDILKSLQGKNLQISNKELEATKKTTETICNEFKSLKSKMEEIYKKTTKIQARFRTYELKKKLKNNILEEKNKKKETQKEQLKETLKEKSKPEEQKSEAQNEKIQNTPKTEGTKPKIHKKGNTTKEETPKEEKKPKTETSKNNNNLKPQMKKNKPKSSQKHKQATPKNTKDLKNIDKTHATTPNQTPEKNTENNNQQHTTNSKKTCCSCCQGNCCKRRH